MNNKGQTLVLFVALLPFIFILFAFSFDFAKLYQEKERVDSIAESSLRYMLDEGRPIFKVKKNIVKNDKDIIIKKISTSDICLEKKVSSVFTNIILKDGFNIKSCFKGKMINNKLIIEKKGK